MRPRAWRSRASRAVPRAAASTARPRSAAVCNAASLVPAAENTSSRAMSGVNAGGCKTPVSITSVSIPNRWRASRTKPTSSPLVSSVPINSTVMTGLLLSGQAANTIAGPPSGDDCIRWGRLPTGATMSFFTREQCLQRLRTQVAAGKPIIGGGAGTGLSAKSAEAGGIDLIIIYNSGRFRMAGRGSLSGMMPYGDANGIVLDMAREVLPVARNTPVLAGVCGTDPFRIMKLFLRDVQSAGFSGVQNFPTVGLFDGTIRVGLEETEMGYGLEVDMIRLAREMGLLTTPYAFNDDEA